MITFELLITIAVLCAGAAYPPSGGLGCQRRMLKCFQSLPQSLRTTDKNYSPAYGLSLCIEKEK